MAKKQVKKVNYGKMFLFIILLVGAGYIIYSNTNVEPQRAFKQEEVVSSDESSQNTNGDEQIDVDKDGKEVLQDTTGMAINPLTGLYIDEEQIEKRPVAVMINNHKRAMPQRGIGSADIMYEVPVEGEFVRLMAVFQNMNVSEIGPIRSSRHYFIDNAFDNDAIYVHFGQSEYAFKNLTEWNSPNLNALAGVMKSPGKYLDHYRDEERKKTKGKEHSAFTTSERIMSSWGKSKYRKETKNSYEPLLTFSDEELDLEKNVNIVAIPYSSYQRSVFEYDEENRVYNRSQFGEPQIDELTGKQLTAKNVILIYTDIYQIPGDKKLCKEVKTIGSGKGVYITNGTMKPIKWSKKDHYTPTKFTYESGNEVEFNKGKTWISYVSDKMKDEVVLSK